jgi:replication factor A1
MLRMHKTQTQLIELIADLKTKKDFEKEIKKRYKIYDELIDQDTIAFLIVDELGRNTQSIIKIVDLAPNGDYTVVGRVLSISDPRTFKKKNGAPGKVINLEITDDTAICRLVLWNGDTNHIKNKEIQRGTIVKIINGYTKLGYTGGMEIHLGRWGLLEVEPTDISLKEEQRKNQTSEISGVLAHKQATKAFFKDDGEFGFVTTISIKEHNVKKEIILWDRCVKEIQPYKIGDTITIKNVIKKWENGKTEFHLTHHGSIEKRK